MPTSKGTPVPFKLAVTAWIDLLGYGNAIASANFNPMDPSSTKTIRRLQAFHEVIAKHSTRHFRSLTVNDGAVFFRDLQWRSNAATYDFLARCWRAFGEVQTVDRDAGGSGARMVLAAGFRVLGSRRGIDASLAHFRSIIRRLESGEINAEQAIRLASSDGRHADIIPQLQANFSFTKSYLAESSGARGGLPGPNFYVDLELFDAPSPEWISLGEAILWENPKLGLSANFAKVRQLAHSRLTDIPPGLRDGLGVAKALAPSQDVLAALQTIEAKG